jgi:hypothetical protein
MQNIRALVCCCLLAGLCAKADEAAPVRYAYYLFMQSESKNCQDCYIPLLLRQEPIEKADEGGLHKSGFLIVTYERDSIWEIKDSPVELSDFNGEEKKVRIAGINYRYQQIEPKEAIRLLSEPEGHIPIHRISAPIKEHQKPLTARWIRELENVSQ